jgi:hypothetical protein
VDDPRERRTLQVNLVVWDRAEAAARHHREAAGSFLVERVSVTVSDAQAVGVIRSAGVFR